MRADDRAEGELHVGVIAERETFPGRSEKSAGAGFGRDDGSEHRPPRNSPPAEREVFEIIFLPAHAQADEDDDKKIEEENAGIDREADIQRRFSHGLNTDEHEISERAQGGSRCSDARC